jgi:hypothetical protein
MTAPVRVYVAAPFSEWPLVREVQARLRAEGAVISEDWTAGIESLPVGVTDGDVSEEVALAAAIADIEGVISADAILSLTVADKSKGCGQWCELGGAIVARCIGTQNLDAARSAMLDLSCTPRIAVCGPMRDRTIFSRFGKRFAAWEDALPYVLGRTT